MLLSQGGNGLCRCTEQQMQVVMCQDKQQPTILGKNRRSHKPENVVQYWIHVYFYHALLFILHKWIWILLSPPDKQSQIVLVNDLLSIT